MEWAGRSWCPAKVQLHETLLIECFEFFKEKCNKTAGCCYETYRDNPSQIFLLHCLWQSHNFLLGFHPPFFLIQLPPGKTALHTGKTDFVQRVTKHKNSSYVTEKVLHIFMVIFKNICLHGNIIQTFCNWPWPSATFLCVFYKLMDMPGFIWIVDFWGRRRRCWILCY